MLTKSVTHGLTGTRETLCNVIITTTLAIVIVEKQRDKHDDDAFSYSLHPLCDLMGFGRALVSAPSSFPYCVYRQQLPSAHSSLDVYAII